MYLININDITPDNSNPRVTDKKRLNYVKYSLQKFGFILPLYITQDKTILSGHQRVMAAKELGIKQVPVEEQFGNTNVNHLNLLFNMVTNDRLSLEKNSFSTNLLKENLDTSILEKIPDTDELYPVMDPVKINAEKLIENNDPYLDIRQINLNKQLYSNFSLPPLIVDTNYKIINGRAKFPLYQSKDCEEVPCVVIPEKYVEIIYYLTNKLTMDYDLDKFGDLFRYNSFKAQRFKARGIGEGFVVRFMPKNKLHGILKFSPELKKTFLNYYGDCIVDFGAGRLTNTTILNRNGIKCIPFEPYIHNESDNVHDKEMSLRVCNYFLDEVEKGTVFTSIFLHAVLNSVPFVEDRRKLLQVITPLISKDSKLVIWVRSVNTLTGIRTLPMDFEENIFVGNVKNNPKLYKYFKYGEVFDLCTEFFKTVKIKDCGGYWYAECTEPKDYDVDDLKESIEFEYNLPFRDGTSMNLANKALKAYSKRLNNPQLTK